MDEPEYVVKEGVITPERIAMDWEEDGIQCHALLHSRDGGFSYQGKWGEPRLSPELQMKATRYQSIQGDALLWVEWKDNESGDVGFSIVHLKNVEGTKKGTSKR